MFTPATTEDIESLIRALLDRQCTSDPLPTWLLKRNAGALAPFLCSAVLKVLSDILLALLTLLDLSAAFDSVDHHTLLQRLQTSYGLGGHVVMN